MSGVFAVAADRAALQAVRGGPTATAAADRAVALRPDVVRYRLVQADVALRSGTVAGIGAAIEATERALDLSPGDPAVLLTRADLKSRKALATGADVDAHAAAIEWSKLADADINCYRCWLGLGYAEALGGESRSALTAFERAAELSRDGGVEAQRAVDQLDQLARVGE